MKYMLFYSQQKKNPFKCKKISIEMSFISSYENYIMVHNVSSYTFQIGIIND
jgi:hypothetical protein